MFREKNCWFFKNDSDSSTYMSCHFSIESIWFGTTELESKSEPNWNWYLLFSLIFWLKNKMNVQTNVFMRLRHFIPSNWNKHFDSMYKFTISFEIIKNHRNQKFGLVFVEIWWFRINYIDKYWIFFRLVIDFCNVPRKKRSAQILTNSIKHITEWIVSYTENNKEQHFSVRR